MEQFLPQVLTATVTFIAAWVAFNTRLTRLEVKLDDMQIQIRDDITSLEQRVNEHNHLNGRTETLEAKSNIQGKQINELFNRMHDVELKTLE